MGLRVGYWRFHEYSRVSVEEDVQEFCGWDLLMRIVEAAETRHDQALVATAFETGGGSARFLCLGRRTLSFRIPG